MHKDFVDRVGQRFGRLVVISYVGNYKWCCYALRKLPRSRGGDLRSGDTTSCGFIVEKYPLGQDVLPERMGSLTNLIVTHQPTPEYKAWQV